MNKKSTNGSFIATRDVHRQSKCSPLVDSVDVVSNVIPNYDVQCWRSWYDLYCAVDQNPRRDIPLMNKKKIDLFDLLKQTLSADKSQSITLLPSAVAKDYEINLVDFEQIKEEQLALAKDHGEPLQEENVANDVKQEIARKSYMDFTSLSELYMSCNPTKWTHCTRKWEKIKEAQRLQKGSDFSIEMERERLKTKYQKLKGPGQQLNAQRKQLEINELRKSLEMEREKLSQCENQKNEIRRAFSDKMKWIKEQRDELKVQRSRLKVERTDIKRQKMEIQKIEIFLDSEKDKVQTVRSDLLRQQNEQKILEKKVQRILELEFGKLNEQKKQIEAKRKKLEMEREQFRNEKVELESAREDIKRQHDAMAQSEAMECELKEQQKLFTPKRNAILAPMPANHEEFDFLTLQTIPGNISKLDIGVQTEEEYGPQEVTPKKIQIAKGRGVFVQSAHLEGERERWNMIQQDLERGKHAVDHVTGTSTVSSESMPSWYSCLSEKSLVTARRYGRDRNQDLNQDQNQMIIAIPNVGETDKIVKQEKREIEKQREELKAEQLRLESDRLEIGRRKEQMLRNEIEGQKALQAQRETLAQRLMKMQHDFGTIHYTASGSEHNHSMDLNKG